MKAFEMCPIRGGELVEKAVEKLSRGGTRCQLQAMGVPLSNGTRLGYPVPCGMGSGRG